MHLPEPVSQCSNFTSSIAPLHLTMTTTRVRLTLITTDTTIIATHLHSSRPCFLPLSGGRARPFLMPVRLAQRTDNILSMAGGCCVWITRQSAVPKGETLS